VEQRARLEAAERDLELTGAVQRGFLPRNSAYSDSRLSVFGFYRPAGTCSGDWWWHEPNRDGTHAILVGDVTGHGPGPAMVTASVATTFRVLTSTGMRRISDVLQHLNREVLEVGEGKYQMTLAALELDARTGRFVLYNAGAPPPLIMPVKGSPEPRVCPGTPLGTAEFFPGIVEGSLAEGNRVLIYTDGIPEISLPNGRFLGVRKLARIYEATRGMNLSDAAGTIVSEVDTARQSMPQEDDWTFTILELKANRASGG
jgi:serine phosphatase RsbU (regulator of sigma subunit)